MRTSQWVSIAASLILIFVLFWGFDTKPKEQKDLEKSRVLVAESADVQVLIQDAKSELGTAKVGEVLRLESNLNTTVGDSAKVEVFKQLSGEWYRLGRYPIAGHYAQQVAEIEQSEQSWSIAGTTYTIGVQRSEIPKERDFSAERAIQAFENAISINPNNAAHQVNLALVYTEKPPEDNPMRGVQMLLKLNQEQPENVLVLVTLARLAVRTGQLDRATERLEKAINIEPDNRLAVCLLANVYEERGETTKAAELGQRCESLN